MRVSLATALLVGGLSVVSTGCIGAPTSRQWMSVGFRSPQQTVATFQTAIRADEPELEYRCFSDDFRRRNQISKMVWLEAREELRRQYPWMRRGIVDAEIEGPVDVRDGRAQCELVSHGTHIRIGFVREEFVEAYGPEGLVHDEYRSFDAATGFQNAGDGGRWIYGTFPVPPTLPDRSELTELRLGREWKLDSFETVDPP